MPKNLFLLKNTKDGLFWDRPSESYGKTSTRTLEDLMGLATTSTDDIAEKLKTLFQLVSAFKLDEARSAVERLRSDGFNEPELKNAETLIRRKELIGK